MCIDIFIEFVDPFGNKHIELITDNDFKNLVKRQIILPWNYRLVIYHNSYPTVVRFVYPVRNVFLKQSVYVF